MHDGLGSFCLESFLKGENMLPFLLKYNFEVSPSKFGFRPSTPLMPQVRCWEVIADKLV